MTEELFAFQFYFHAALLHQAFQAISLDKIFFCRRYDKKKANPNQSRILKGNFK